MPGCAPSISSADLERFARRLRSRGMTGARAISSADLEAISDPAP